MKYISVIILIISIFLTGCSSRDSLTLGVIPHISPSKLEKDIMPLKNYLEKEMNTEINLFIPDNYQDLISAINNRKVDIAQFGALSYIVADNYKELELLVVRKRKDYGISYNSLLISGSASGIENIEDCRNKKIAFVNTSSTSGFIIPYSLFKSRDIELESFFSGYIFSESHDKAVLSVINKESDIAAVSGSLLNDMIKSRLINGSEIKIVWKSDPIPGSPYAARIDLDKRHKRNFTKAMLLMHEKAPEIIEKSSSGSIEKYVKAEKKMYNNIRNIFNILGEDFISTFILN